MSAGVGIREYPWRWRGGGGWGLNKVFDGEAGSRGPTPYLIKKLFLIGKVPLSCTFY